MPAKSGGDFVVMPPDVVAPVTSVTATSVMGWGGFLISLLTLSMLVWQKITQRGKSLATIDGKIDKLCEQVEDVENTQKVMDGHLSTLSEKITNLEHDWRGVQGNNGGKKMLHEHDQRLDAIEDRNREIDAIARHERERQQEYGGPERRQGPRREKDRELNNLLPEEREDK